MLGIRRKDLAEYKELIVKWRRGGGINVQTLMTESHTLFL